MVGVEGVANTASIPCPKGAGDTTIGGDTTGWDLPNEGVDGVKEGHRLSVTSLVCRTIFSLLRTR